MTDSKDVPTWDPLSAEVLSDQRAAYDRLRATCGVARSARGVTVFRHADVVAAATDPLRFSSSASSHRQVPNSLDPPEHTTFRTAIDQFFTPDRIRRLEPVVASIAATLVDALPRGSTFDAVTDLGYPFAVMTQTAWLGWGGIESDLLVWMHDNHRATRSGDPVQTAAVADAYDALVGAQVRRRRGCGGAAPDDPTTELLRVRVDGRPLTDDEIISILRNWTAGDLGSIAAAIGVVVHFIATRQHVQAELRADRSCLAAAVDEMLRLDDPFLANRRRVTVRTTVAGHELEPGTRIYLNWTSANRDPEVFPDPDAFRPAEHAPHNLVYGIGIHACPGRSLATLELVVLLDTLLARTHRITPAAETAPQRETYPVGGWRHVPVQLA